MREITLYITLYNEDLDRDVEYEVEAKYYAGFRGGRDGYGRQIEPDDEPELVFISIKDENGNEYDRDDVFDDYDIEKLYDDAYDTYYDRG